MKIGDVIVVQHSDHVHCTEKILAFSADGELIYTESRKRYTKAEVFGIVRPLLNHEPRAGQSVAMKDGRAGHLMEYKEKINAGDLSFNRQHCWVFRSDMLGVIEREEISEATAAN